MPRFFAYCPVKGCRAAKPFMTRAVAGRPVIRTAEGLHDLVNVRDFRIKVAYEPMRKRGIVCEEHGPMRVESLNATYNPDKECDGRCVTAKRASCECSCGGVFHGSGA